VCTSDFLYWDEGSLALVLLLAGSLQYLACTFFFSFRLAMYVIGGYRESRFLITSQFSGPHSTLRTLPYTPPLLPIHLLRHLQRELVKLLCPVVPLAFRAQSLPTHHFSILPTGLLSLPPVPPLPLSIDGPCQFLKNVDLSVVHTALRLIITPRRPYIPSSSCSTWLLCLYAFTLVCIACSFERRQGGRY